jgi:hypothetical protein
VRHARARGWWGLTHLANRVPGTYGSLAGPGES